MTEPKIQGVKGSVFFDSPKPKQGAVSMQPDSPPHKPQMADLTKRGGTAPMAEVLTLLEACAFLRISRPTIFSLLQRRLIPAKKVGRGWRFERTMLINWIQGNVVSCSQRGKR
jgi:excisionase family DNA binding protein